MSGLTYFRLCTLIHMGVPRDRHLETAASLACRRRPCSSNIKLCVGEYSCMAVSLALDSGTRASICAKQHISSLLPHRIRIGCTTTSASGVWSSHVMPWAPPKMCRRWSRSFTCCPAALQPHHEQAGHPGDRQRARTWLSHRVVKAKIVHPY